VQQGHDGGGTGLGLIIGTKSRFGHGVGVTETLSSVAAGQSLTTASSLLGKRIAALTDDNRNIAGVVDRVSVTVDPDKGDQRIYKVHIGDQAINLTNVREVKG
jgi:hypothetical protein